MKLVHGWEIVCPDKKKRHPPFDSQTAAEHMAKQYDKSQGGKCMCHPEIALKMGRCAGGGKHKVKPVAYTVRESPEKGEA